jgi:hypothetical protein
MNVISKLCADHLRDFCSNNNIKLKSGHAHELVAAFFGYKSKAAMQADTSCSIENIRQANILVLMPSAFINERRQSLEGLPADLADTSILGEEMFAYLMSKNKFAARPFGAWGHLAEKLTTEYLQQHGNLILPPSFGPFERAHNIFNKPLYEFNPKIEATNKEVKLVFKNRYYGSHSINFEPINVVIAIKLQRIAGHVGYAKADISVAVIEDSEYKDKFSEFEV